VTTKNSLSYDLIKIRVTAEKAIRGAVQSFASDFAFDIRRDFSFDSS